MEKHIKYTQQDYSAHNTHNNVGERWPLFAYNGHKCIVYVYATSFALWLFIFNVARYYTYESE